MGTHFSIRRPNDKVRRQRQKKDRIKSQEKRKKKTKISRKKHQKQETSKTTESKISDSESSYNSEDNESNNDDINSIDDSRSNKQSKDEEDNDDDSDKDYTSSKDNGDQDSTKSTKKDLVEIFKGKITTSNTPQRKRRRTSTPTNEESFTTPDNKTNPEFEFANEVYKFLESIEDQVKSPKLQQLKEKCENTELNIPHTQKNNPRHPNIKNASNK